MTLSNFTGTVRKIEYKTITEDESKDPKKYFSAIELEAFYDIFGDTISQYDYYAAARVEANKRGKKKPSKHDIWSCIIYLTPEQYADREIEVNDIIEIQRPTLKKKDIKLFVYDEEKLKELPPTQIRRAFVGSEDCAKEGRGEGCPTCPLGESCPDKAKHYKPYARYYASDCRLSAHGYKILYKADEVFRGALGTNGLKISFENKQEMLDFESGDYYITPEESIIVNKLLISAAGKPIEMRFFAKKVKVRTAQVKCALSYDDNINSNLLTITVI